MSFLGEGTYDVSNTSGDRFAWTYSTGTCEHWAMKGLISTGESQQSPVSPGFSSLESFVTAMCRMAEPPETYFEATYVAVDGSSIECDP